MTTAKAKIDHGRVAGLQFEERHLGPLVRHVARQLAVGDLLHQLDRFAGTDAGRGAAVDERGRVHVVAGQRAARFSHARRQGADRHHAALSVAHLEPARSSSMRLRKRGLGLDVHLPGSAETVEVVDVERAQIDLQRVERVAERHLHALALPAIDVDIELRHVGAEQAEQARQCPVVVPACWRSVPPSAPAVRWARDRRGPRS